MKKLIIALPFLISLCACGPKPDPSPPPPTSGDICDQACAAWEHFAKYDDACKVEAQPTADGIKCADLCRQIEVEDWTTVYPQCIPKAKNCQEAKLFSSNGCQ